MRLHLLITPLLLLPCGPAAFAADPIRGFPQSDIAQERQWEAKAKAETNASRIGQYDKRLSAKPHLAGTPGSKAVADYLLGTLQEWGLDAHLETFEALLPTPKIRVLELLSPRPYRARLAEAPLTPDKSSQDRDQIPTYNAYSGSADVSAPLVYANYGMPGDYEFLAKNHIDVRGKIVITRYGGGWRGLKPRLAAEHGAVGCLIYSDPKDDGYYRGDVYPKGAWRPAGGVQRGSVMDMTLYPGDPLSPGWASEPGSRRLTLPEAKTLMTIPVLPISYEDAQPLLQALGGQVAPPDWRGALGMTYHLGDGSARVHLKVEMDNAIHPVYDVIARIEGSEFPDQEIMAGNHHDAWVHGALDPCSGAAALLETGRALSVLLQTGWRPRRTIVLAFWDAEEFGLIGSTEFAEKHQEELSRNLVAYINSDSNSKGQLGAGGSHTLEEFVSEVERDVADPYTGKPLIETPRVRSSVLAPRQPGSEPPPVKKGFSLEALGSGSDYTSFLQHLGIASLNLGFGDEDGSGGIYHSTYDSYYWYTHFADTNFFYGRTLATVTATSLLRLAGATVLPFQFLRFSQTLSRYLDQLEKEEKTAGRIDLGTLRRELAGLEKSAEGFEAAYARGLSGASRAASPKLAELNQLLFQTERKMLLAEGLPRREWFHHAIYAPGSLTGYDVKTMPGIREAIEAGQSAEAQQQADRAAEVIRAVAGQVDESTKLLGGL